MYAFMLSYVQPWLNKNMKDYCTFFKDCVCVDFIKSTVIAPFFVKVFYLYLTWSPARWINISKGPTAEEMTAYKSDVNAITLISNISGRELIKWFKWWDHIPKQTECGCTKINSIQNMPTIDRQFSILFSWLLTARCICRMKMSLFPEETSQNIFWCNEFGH